MQPIKNQHGVLVELGYEQKIHSLCMATKRLTTRITIRLFYVYGGIDNNIVRCVTPPNQGVIRYFKGFLKCWLWLRYSRISHGEILQGPGGLYRSEVYSVLRNKFEYPLNIESNLTGSEKESRSAIGSLGTLHRAGKRGDGRGRVALKLFTEHIPLSGVSPQICGL